MQARARARAQARARHARDEHISRPNLAFPSETVAVTSGWGGALASNTEETSDATRLVSGALNRAPDVDVAEAEQSGLFDARTCSGHRERVLGVRIHFKVWGKKHCVTCYV